MVNELNVIHKIFFYNQLTCDYIYFSIQHVKSSKVKNIIMLYFVIYVILHSVLKVRINKWILSEKEKVLFLFTWRSTLYADDT